MWNLTGPLNELVGPVSSLLVTYFNGLFIPERKIKIKKSFFVDLIYLQGKKD